MTWARGVLYAAACTAYAPGTVFASSGEKHELHESLQKSPRKLDHDYDS